MSEQPFKLVITGVFNSGKTTFVRSLSEVAVVDTEKETTSPEEQKIKSSTTVAMDYGRIDLGDTRIQLFGTPGQTRFDFMREILAKDMNGFLVLVDLAAPETFDDSAALLAQFKEYHDVPYAVVANKSDLSTQLSHDDLRQRLQLPNEIEIFPSVATDRDSVREVVGKFLRSIRG